MTNNPEPTISPELIDRLNSSADKIGQWVQEAEVFAREQAPIVVQEMLAWGMWKAITTLVALIIATTFFGILSWILYKKDEKECSEATMHFLIISVIIFVFLCIGGLAGGIDAISTIIKINVAPRIYLLDHLGLLK